MQNLTQPTLLLKPFAVDGDRNVLPDENEDVTNPQLADLTNGFPPITGLKPADGGLPPERRDMNALGYLTTLYDYFYQVGGTFGWNDTVVSAIGGYPQGARLWYIKQNGETIIVRSGKDNNTDNFTQNESLIDGVSWIQDTPTMSDLTAFINRWQLVTSLPGTPDPNTWYFIEETL